MSDHRASVVAAGAGMLFFAFFIPRAEATDGHFLHGVGAINSLGVQFKVGDQIKAGLAYTSTQWFQDFEWNTVQANPNVPTYGQAEKVKFRLDVPQVVGL